MDWATVASWVAILLTLIGALFGGGVLYGRLGKALERGDEHDKDLEELRKWREDIRVTLATEFVRKSEMKDEIRSAIAPVRRLANATHEIVVAIAEKLNVPHPPIMLPEDHGEGR